MRRRSAIALCVLTSLASSSCSGTGLLVTDGGHERLALNRLLLAAYERPTFDDARNDVPAFCADFTPGVARAIASAAHGSDCPSALRPFTSEFGHASRLSRSLLVQFMRHFQISRIMRDRSYASATVGFGGGGSLPSDP